jgi:hypothetical protein
MHANNALSIERKCCIRSQTGIALQHDKIQGLALILITVYCNIYNTSKFCVWPTTQLWVSPIMSLLGV